MVELRPVERRALRRVAGGHLHGRDQLPGSGRGHEEAHHHPCSESHPGEVTWKSSHGNWISFLLGLVSLLDHI